jgi:short-subunit dehydrogenase
MTAAPPASVLILGAASDMARAIARRYAKAGASLVLAARRVERLQPDADDLRIRHRVTVRLVEFDVLDIASLDAVGDIPDTVICAVGVLGDQAAAQADAAALDMVIRTNFTGPAAILGEIANRMEARRSGTIIGISSVAGDRGRATNYVYGSAKAGFTAFLSGLRNRLAGKGVTVITVKPGFCRTKMTAGMKLPGPLTAEPEQVAEAVFNAQAKGRDVLYVLPVWRLVMTVIRLIPERLFKRMSL